LSGVSQVVLAALTNATAVGRYLWSLNESCLVVASGTRGRIALEDVLAAGAVARVWPEECRSDAAQIATTLFSASTDDLIGWVRRAQHGRDLVALGRDDDLAFAARLDCCAVVPRLGEDGWIRGEISP
jgi:phosphosulfolactate phosphohydrolase-like enzyme